MSKYGESDEIGALNEIQPADILEAVGLVKRGVVYDLGRVLESGIPVMGPRTWQQKLVVDAHLKGHCLGQNQFTWLTEFQAGTFQMGTHLDALGHVGMNGIYYNDHRIEDIADENGLHRLGADKIPPIISRGVLLDIPRVRGCSMLSEGDIVGVRDLEKAEELAGTTVRQGDVVLIHTGWGALWMTDNTRYVAAEPGLGVEGAHWLVGRRIAAAGADNFGVEIIPGEDPDLFGPVHQIMIRENGVFLMENIKTEELAAAGIYQFLAAITVVKAKGATGSWISPAAIV